MSESKVCTGCQVNKPLDLFPWCKDHRLTAGGRVGSRCKGCVNERAKKWQRENYQRAFANQMRWRGENRERYNALMGQATRRYLAARRNNTPKWADHDKMLEVYEAARLMREAGLDVEVDHIVPLQGVNASGLHVHWNLQIIEKTENRQKRDSVNPDAYSIPNAWDSYCSIA